MKTIFLGLLLFLLSTIAIAQSNKVSVVSAEKGMKLVVDGKDFIVNGMNWDYSPIGTNYTYILWNQSDDFIKNALEPEMTFLKKLGVNTIRQNTSIQPKWIKYIYEKYGIYTMLNHTFGRYGLTLNREWVSNTDYSNPLTRDLLLKESKEMVETYKNTPGLLLFLLGNENNYGLFWEGAETEDIPQEDRQSTIKAYHLYHLFNEAILEMKKIDTTHPIAICNGDLQFLDIIKKECPDIDIFGTNIYRGIGFGDAFEKVKESLHKPVLFTEFGSDAFNASQQAEDQESQAYYLLGNWKEIYENVFGVGKSANSLGGFTFQFSDGWWKHDQTLNLYVHDTIASWSNGGYSLDFRKGGNNMNEEWFGICAKGFTNSDGFYKLYPRASYYALLKVHKINPFAKGVTIEKIDGAFSKIKLKDSVLKALKNTSFLEKVNKDRLRN